eukprot:1159880-Pelagomonas_calceolata.AAC.2
MFHTHGLMLFMQAGPPASCPSTPGPKEEEGEEEATGAAAGVDKDDVGLPVRWGAYTSGEGKTSLFTRAARTE